MKLVVGWTIVGAFVFTMVVTLLSLVGWVKFADKSQQKKLFATLIVGVVVAAGGGLVSGARLDPKPVAQALREEGASEALVSVANEMLGSPSAPAIHLDKAALSRVVEKIRVPPDSTLGPGIEELRLRVNALPDGLISPEAARELRELPTFRMEQPGLNHR
jgi:hypothetical protein